MPQQPRKRPKITPKYLLARIDAQLSAAGYYLRRLRYSLEPHSEGFHVKELREFEQCTRAALKQIGRLKTLPKSAWKR